MNVYDAIMKAADHIERNPGVFNFWSENVPDNCNTSGCAAGWIGHFAGMRNCSFSAVATKFLGEEDGGTFLRKLDRLGDWHHSAAECARVLRKYAEKYHGKTKEPNKGIPDSVLSIFRTRQTDPDRIAA